MDVRLLLVKSITLLYRESLLKNNTDSSSEVVRTVLGTIQMPENGMGVTNDRKVLSSLRDTALEMCSNPNDHEYDKSTLLQRLKLNCENDEQLYDIVVQGVEEDIQENQLKRSIVNLRKSINNHFREQKISDILNVASYQFKYKRDRIKNIDQFVTETIAQLEPLQMSAVAKDPAVLSDIDLGNEESVTQIFADARKINSGERILKTGWQDVNKFMQGGLRPTDLCIINGLQHKYKTGFLLSFFAHVALFNIPVLVDPNKKPLLVLYSFEDEMVDTLQTLYIILKYEETRVYVETKDITEADMSSYIRQRMQINGFYIKFKRVDPTQWTYRNFCNSIIELEVEGYEIKAAFVDQLAMLPTAGCNTAGPMGTDLRDLFRRIKNFCAPKGIPVVTPHQLSTEAKNLIRTGIPEDHFVKEIAEKGYTAGSKQLDQDVTLEIYIHLFKHNRETFLSVYRGKHRVPAILPDEDKYVLYKFPKGMPIPPDLNGENIGMKKLPSVSSNVDDSLFTF